MSDHSVSDLKNTSEKEYINCLFSIIILTDFFPQENLGKHVLHWSYTVLNFILVEQVNCHQRYS